MTDLVNDLNELLKKYGALPINSTRSLNVPRTDHFLDEAYKLNASIKELDTFLKGIRQSYLSREAPPRRIHGTTSKKPWKHLTNRDKEEIDAKAKQMIRELNVGIRILAEAEEVRRQTDITISKKKQVRSGLGAFGVWAAGGFPQQKSQEQELEDAKAYTITTHRENLLFYLRKGLEKCASQQAFMMEKRISREVEKNRSILGQGYFDHMLDFDDGFSKAIAPPNHNATLDVPLDSQTANVPNELTPEQIQIFERDNQDMLRHYESTLDQVRIAQKSMAEISDLQTQLVQNLATQTAHIDQLVTDSYLTTENVGGGNKQLKKATERKSTAKYVFYATCGLSLFLVLWDLAI